MVSLAPLAAARSWLLDAGRRQADLSLEAAASVAASALVMAQAYCRSAPDPQAAWSIRTQARTAEGSGTQSRAAEPPVRAGEPPVRALEWERRQRIAGSGQLAGKAPAG
jgi:hypothetical protein